MPRNRMVPVLLLQSESVYPVLSTLAVTSGPSLTLEQLNATVRVINLL